MIKAGVKICLKLGSNEERLMLADALAKKGVDMKEIIYGKDDVENV